MELAIVGIDVRIVAVATVIIVIDWRNNMMNNPFKVSISKFFNWHQNLSLYGASKKIGIQRLLP